MTKVPDDERPTFEHFWFWPRRSHLWRQPSLKKGGVKYRKLSCLRCEQSRRDSNIHRMRARSSYGESASTRRLSIEGKSRLPGDRSTEERAGTCEGCDRLFSPTRTHFIEECSSVKHAAVNHLSWYSCSQGWRCLRKQCCGVFKPVRTFLFQP